MLSPKENIPGNDYKRKCVKMKYMAPIWMRYPDSEPDSIVWRFGLGEEYIAEWITWKKQLSTDEKSKYDALFPVPVLWHGHFSGNKGLQKISLRSLYHAAVAK